MFFVFYILVLTIYISNTNNYVLKKKHIRGDKVNVDVNENIVNFQDVSNNSWNSFSRKHLFQIIQDLANTKTPNLQSNVFDKRLSDEMFSIKQLGNEKNKVYSTPNLLSPINSIATPTFELKQKWPIVDLLSKSDNIPGSLQYIDEFEKLYLINSSSIDNELTSNKNAVVEKKYGYSDSQNEDTNDKIIGLRSLSGNAATAIPGRMYHSIAIKQCTCTKTNPTTTNSPVKMVSRIRSTLHKCTAGSTGDCTRKAVSYSILPYYVPYDIGITTSFPSFYYPLNIYSEYKVPKPSKHRKPSKPSLADDLYYEDSLEGEKYDHDRYEDEYLENDRESLKHNKWKLAKGEVIVHQYDEKSQDNKISWDTKIHHENPNVLANDILDDLKTYYSDTIIKDCYCSSSSSGNLIPNYCFILCLLFWWY